MSPIYEDKDTTREDLEKIRLKSRCSVCGARLNIYLDPESGKAFLACWDWLRTHHEGIEREASRYEKEGLASLNIPTRRKLMTEDLGPKRTSALMKYEGVLSLTKQEAREILTAVFPEAPDQEVTRAVLLCASYQLNPLMKHVFLIPFNKGKPNESWATVIGIKAKRLLASRPDRKGQPRPYSYVDNTPRVMTEEEQKITFGEVDGNKLWVVTKVRDPLTGAEAVGYGYWPIDTVPYGAFGSSSGDKGNTKFNMAAIRSESQALDRLRPGEMPVGIEVMPEEFIEAEYTVKETKGGEKVGAEAVAKQGEEGKGKAKTFSPTEAVKSRKIGASAARDPQTIKNFGDLFQALWDDFHLCKSEALRELNVSSQEEITELPSECYQRIATVRD